MSNNSPPLRARLLKAADDLTLAQREWQLIIGAETLKAQQQNTIDVLRAAEARVGQLEAALWALQTEHDQSCIWWRHEEDGPCSCQRGSNQDIFRVALEVQP